MKTLAEELKERLENTPKQQLEREWKEICDIGFEGPTVKEFLKSSSPFYMFNIDWEMLKQQKETFMRMFSMFAISESEWEDYSGLLHLIDAIQDYAVDVLGIDENVVFNLENDE